MQNFSLADIAARKLVDVPVKKVVEFVHAGEPATMDVWFKAMSAAEHETFWQAMADKEAPLADRERVIKEKLADLVCDDTGATMFSPENIVELCGPGLYTELCKVMYKLHVLPTEITDEGKSASS